MLGLICKNKHPEMGRQLRKFRILYFNRIFRSYVFILKISSYIYLFMLWVNDNIVKATLFIKAKKTLYKKCFVIGTRLAMFSFWEKIRVGERLELNVCLRV